MCLSNQCLYLNWTGRPPFKRTARLRSWRRCPRWIHRWAGCSPWLSREAKGWTSEPTPGPVSLTISWPKRYISTPTDWRKLGTWVAPLFDTLHVDTFWVPPKNTFSHFRYLSVPLETYLLIGLDYLLGSLASIPPKEVVYFWTTLG